jgi:hypothetical protein
MSDAGDQLNLEIADVLGISVGQIRGDHRIVGTGQPANRNLDPGVFVFAAHPGQHALGLEGAIPPRTGLGMARLAHALDVEPDVFLGKVESATDPRPQGASEPGLGITEQSGTDHRQ